MLRVTHKPTQGDSQHSVVECRGPCAALHAPGVNVVSAGLASDTASAVKTGTSMSAPHVSGVAALYLEANPVSRYHMSTHRCLHMRVYTCLAYMSTHIFTYVSTHVCWAGCYVGQALQQPDGQPVHDLSHRA